MRKPIVNLSFEEISSNIRATSFPVVDCVLGILNGGLVPASLIAHQLMKPLHFLPINYRDEKNKPRYESPQLLTCYLPQNLGEHVLVVDDVSVSGQTLRLANAQLKEYRVTSFVLIGKADLVLFPHINECVNWPWHSEQF